MGLFLYIYNNLIKLFDMISLSNINFLKNLYCNIIIVYKFKLLILLEIQFDYSVEFPECLNQLGHKIAIRLIAIRLISMHRFLF